MKMKKCPFCEWEISSTAKKCKHCGERVKEQNSEEWKNKKSNKTTARRAVKKTIEKADDWPKQSKISKFISDNLLLVIIWAIIIFSVVKSFFNNTNNQWNNIENDVDESTEITESIDNGHIKYKIKGGDNNITPTYNWFILFKDKIWECEITWSGEIIDFIELVKNTKNGETIRVNRGEPDEKDWECNHKSNVNTSDWKNIAILLDNSYSKNEDWDIDKSWPNQRIDSLGGYINNNYLPNWSKIEIVFMFTTVSKDNSNEPDGNIYKFKIDPSVFSIKYIKNSGWDDIRFEDWRHFINLWETSISYTFSWIEQNDIKCIYDAWNNEHVCYDAENVYKKIQNIYSQIYDKDERHTDDIMLIKTLSMSKSWFSWFDKEEVFILTKWEFVIWYEDENKYLSKLKQKYKTQWWHDQWVEKTHSLSEFNMRYANRYQKDSKYESFWSEAIEALRPELPVCSWVKVYVIWLTRSAEFKPLAEKVYNQIFAPCEVIFK